MAPVSWTSNLLPVTTAILLTARLGCATPSLLATNIGAVINNSAPVFSTASNTTEFAKYCITSAQIRSISCTGTVAKLHTNDSRNNETFTQPLNTIASLQFLHPRRISLNSFNINILNADRLAELFGDSKIESIDSATTTSECEELVLSYNNIRRIEARAFRHFPHLKTLDLSYNSLETIKTDAFDKLHSLAILDLSSNQLRWFSPSPSPAARPSTLLPPLAALVMLNLRDNKLKRIPAGEWLCHMPALQHLSVARNKLDAVAVSNLTAKTSCSGNSALENSTKSPSVATRAQLTHLDLHGNLLYSLENMTFRRKDNDNSINLLFLDLSSTALTQVPSLLPESLRDLRLSQNNITTIRDDDFRKCCPNLSLLVMEHSNLTYIAEGALTGLKNLERIWISNNQLTTVPRLPTALHGLFLDNNQIRQVNQIQTDEKVVGQNETSTVAELQHLHLRNNRIFRFEHCAFCNLPRLAILDLSENAISGLSSSTNNAKNPHTLTSSLFSTSTQLELLNLSENFIGDGQRLADGLSGLQSVAHVDFSFCTSLSQRRRAQQTSSETPEEEYKDTYDESIYISSNVKTNLGLDASFNTSTNLFTQLILQQYVERIDLGYCAPLVNDLFDFVEIIRKSNKTFAAQNSLTISLNGYNFAATTGADASGGGDRVDDLFNLLALLPAIDVDISDTEWNCSDALRVSTVVELLRQTRPVEEKSNTSQQFSSGRNQSQRHRHRGALVQTSGTELTCLYPASLNGLSLHDERVIAHMEKLKSALREEENVLRKKKQLLPVRKPAEQQNHAQLYANTVMLDNTHKKALIDDEDDESVNGNTLKSRDGSPWWDISSLVGENNNEIDSDNSSTESHDFNPSNNMSCSSWQALLTKQYYKLDSLLRHFQTVMHLRYSGDSAAYDQQQQQQHHASVNRNDDSIKPHPATETRDQWWPLVKTTATDVHAVRQAAIFSALFVALLMLTCMCASLLIYCCYYRCLIWSTSRRRRLTNSRYSKSSTDNVQQLNGRAVIQLTTTNSDMLTRSGAAATTNAERLSSATSVSSVPSTASSSATSASSSTSAASLPEAKRTSNNNEVVHYSRYRNQISTTPSTIFSIVDAANEHQQQQATMTRQQQSLWSQNNNADTTLLYDYPNSVSQQQYENVPYSAHATGATAARSSDVAHNNKLLKGISDVKEVRGADRAVVRRGGAANANEEIYFAHPLVLQETQNPQNTNRSRPSGLVHEQF